MFKTEKIPCMFFQRDGHATTQMVIYANITQTGRIRVYCRWFWLVLLVVVGGFLGHFGLVPWFSNYERG